MSSRELFDAGLELVAAGSVHARAELALSESRVARIKAAAELERAGEHDRAAALLAQVRAEQEELIEWAAAATADDDARGLELALGALDMIAAGDVDDPARYAAEAADVIRHVLADGCHE